LVAFSFLDCYNFLAVSFVKFLNEPTGNFLLSGLVSELVAIVSVVSSVVVLTSLIAAVSQLSSSLRLIVSVGVFLSMVIGQCKFLVLSVNKIVLFGINCPVRIVISHI
jgi:hypothetical protein